MSSYIINPYSFGSGSSDPSFSSVKLLLGFEGVDGATTTSDESSAAKTITMNNGAQIDTAQFKFGTSSCLFDGVNDAVGLATYPPTDTDVSLNGRSNWCFEGWVRFNSLAGDQGLFGAWNPPSNGYLFRYTGGNIEWFCYGGTNVSNLWSPSTGTWYHYAVTFDGTLRVFIDGIILANTHTGAQNGEHGDSFAVGSQNMSGGRPFNGWQDEFRFSHVTRYTGNFTPPTAAFPRS